MNTETNRKYKCAFTKEEYTLFRNTQTGAFSLIKTKDNENFDYPIGNEISGFEIRAYDVLYKFKDKTELEQNEQNQTLHTSYL